MRKIKVREIMFFVNQSGQLEYEGSILINSKSTWYWKIRKWVFFNLTTSGKKFDKIIDELKLV